MLRAVLVVSLTVSGGCVTRAWPNTTPQEYRRLREATARLQAEAVVITREREALQKLCDDLEMLSDCDFVRERPCVMPGPPPGHPDAE